MDEFKEGVFWSVAQLVRLNMPKIAADILEKAGYLNVDCSELLDKPEKAAMRKLQEQDSRCNFAGLDY